MSWRTVGRRDFAAVADFLRLREDSCCTLTAHLVFRGLLHLPSPWEDALFAHMEGDRCRGATLAGAHGFCFAILEDAPRDDDAAIAALVARKRLPAVLMSSPEDGRRLEMALGRGALEERINRYLVLEGAPRECAFPKGLSVHEAGPSDVEELLPLQEAYEREEVVPSIHGFDPRSARATLVKSLDRQLVVVARLGGRVVAKAQTNARGEAWDQIGGIFVEPGLRGWGIAPALLAALCDRLASVGRTRRCLFVREENQAAQRAYLKVGFRPSGRLLRIAYHA